MAHREQHAPGTFFFKIVTDAVFTRGTFTWGKCHFTTENVTQYNRNVNVPQQRNIVMPCLQEIRLRGINVNRNVNLPQVNVSRVNTA